MGWNWHSRVPFIWVTSHRDFSTRWDNAFSFSSERSKRIIFWWLQYDTGGRRSILFVQRIMLASPQRLWLGNSLLQALPHRCLLHLTRVSWASSCLQGQNWLRVLMGSLRWNQFVLGLISYERYFIILAFLIFWLGWCSFLFRFKCRVYRL